VNVVDDPDLCTFIIPAIVDRNPLIISVSSSGSSPVLARRIRSDIEARYPSGYAELSRYLGDRRGQVAEHLTTERERRYFWERLLDSNEFIDLVLTSNREAADALFEKVLSEGKSPRGAVYLIGAGPGDPELLTFKALRLLQQADIVLYDRLIGEGILELARRDADKIYVGKQRSEHAMPQSEINATLLSLAKSGKRVARLKGGDPFIFGRGGEEIEGLLTAGVDFEVVPGVTAASGAACYAGIPLTHHDHAQSVRFITGHTKDHQLDLPWQQLMNEQETLVFYMGLAGLAIITRELIRAGRRPDTPIAIIEKATRVDQRVISGTLASIQQVAEMEKPEAPTLLIIGGVVTLHSSLRWYSPQQN
jgi:uroporphyrin-III C-methyltransferase/precorrin-2 dehydrogenase/sirohydrochlorin ferrochelatase